MGPETERLLSVSATPKQTFEQDYFCGGSSVSALHSTACRAKVCSDFAITICTNKELQCVIRTGLNATRLFSGGSWQLRGTLSSGSFDIARGISDPSFPSPHTRKSVVRIVGCERRAMPCCHAAKSVRPRSPHLWSASAAPPSSHFPPAPESATKSDRYPEAVFLQDGR